MLRARVSAPSITHGVTGEPSTLYAFFATVLVAVVLGIGVESAAQASSPAVSPIPVGMIVPYAGSEAAIPAGWLPADGRPLSRSAHTALFAALGTSFGAGDGTATFNLPDLRGRFPLGLSESGTGSTLGGTGGSLAHGAAQMSLPAHDHEFVVPDHTHPVKALQSHSHTWTGSLHEGHWEWPDWAVAHNSGTLDPTCEPGCADGWTSVTGGGQTVRSTPAAAQAAVGSADAPYQAVRYVVKVSETTAVPCGAIWGFGGADAPEGAAVANGAPASGGVAGCLDAGFAGRLPDLRQRFALGAGAAAAPGTTGGEISHDHDVTVGNHTHSVTLADRTHVLNEPDHVHVASHAWTNFDYERYDPFSTILAGVAEVSGSPSTVGNAHTSTPAGGGTLTTAPTGAQSLTTSRENPPFLTANFVVPGTAGDPLAGSIGAYGGAQAPAGWLVADGTCVATTRYPALFNAIGYAFGGSGGSFCLPDLRQRFLLGKSTSGTGSEIGAVGGAIDHVHTTTVAGDRPVIQKPPHEHTWTFPAHIHGVEGAYSENAGARAECCAGQPQTHNGTVFWSSASGAQTVRSAPSAPQNVPASELSPAQTLTTTPANPPYQVVNFLIATGDDGSGPPPPEEPPSTSAFPVGLVVPFAGSDSAVPNGWLPADGRQLSRAAYGDLFAAIGTAYGSGDGSSTFSVPDLRGRFGLGLAAGGTGSSLGATGGTLDHGAGTVTLPAHTHDFAIPGHTHSVNSLAPHSHTWSGGLRHGHWEWPCCAVHFDTGVLHEQCSPGCNNGWTTVGGGASSATSAPFSVQANAQSANPPYQVVRFVIKAQESAAAPCGAIWGYGGASPPGGTQLARSGPADAGLAGCLDGSFAGNLPDLRGRFPLGQAVAGPASSLAATGGALGHTHRVTTGDHAHAVGVPNHTHPLAEPDHVHTVGYGVTQYDTERYDPFEWIMGSPMSTSSGSTTAGQVRTSTPAGGGTFTTTAGGAQTLDTSAADPPYVTVNYALYKSRGYVPDAGILAPYAGPVAPDGWVLADGRCLPTAGRYAKLFNALGYAYGGSGDSFCVPDLRQRFPLGRTSSGAASALGVRGGAIDHVHTATIAGHRPSLHIPAHSHTWAFPNHQHWIHGSGPISAGSNGGQPQVWWGSYLSSAGGGQTVTSTASAPVDVQATGNSPAQTLTTAAQNPPFQVLNYVIATGVTGAELRADTVHSDGADLDWLRYAGPSSTPFREYEVHRSADPAFTPSAGTLLATIRDASITSYRDTTAGPARAFTYLVLTNGATSNRVTVTLPQDGKARKLLQPGPAAGQATYIGGPGAGNACSNHGAESSLLVDSVGGARRALLRFDLRDVPAEAAIEQATLTLRRTLSPATPATVELHRATAAWEPGTGIDECTGDGATWLDAASGVQWQVPGGDFDAAAAASRAIPAGAPAGWDDFDLTALAQRWTSGETPNLGLVAKLAVEDTGSPVAVAYYADDGTQWADLRPKLAVDYVDGSHARGPEVAVSSPGSDSTVSGAVTLVAVAGDDRRVESVEFLLDGSAVGAPDTSEPFEAAWDSRGVANGVHTLVVRATDDAGNVGSSPTVSFSVANSAPPTAAVAGVVQSYDSDVLADRPGGYWRLGEAAPASSAADSSGNGNAGTFDSLQLGAAGAIADDADTAATFAPSGPPPPPPEPPPVAGSSDAFANAVVLSGTGGTATASNVGATKESGEPSHAGSSGGRSIWWRWTAPATNGVMIKTAGSSFNTLLGVYTGSAVNGLSTVASNDNVSSGVTTSRVAFRAVAGTTYRIAVDGRSAASGNVQLTWSQAGADRFADAGPLLGASGTVEGANVGATKETGEPNHAGRTGGRSLWWQWTATAGGLAELRTAGSAIDTVLAVYTGSTVNALTTVASNDNYGGLNTSRVTFTAVAGTTYRIAVDSRSSAGALTLTWNLPGGAVVPAVSVGDRFDHAARAPFSLEAWVKPTAIDATPRRIVSKERGAGATRQGYALSLSSSGLLFERVRDGVADSVVHPAGLPPNAWSHVVATYDGDTMRLFVDGLSVASGAGVQQLTDHASPFLAGRNSASGGDGFAGSLDEVAVYPAALTSLRVGAHHAAGLGEAQQATTVSGTVTIGATASDDVGVTKVEFFADDVPIGTDTTAPYSVVWDTLDPQRPFYDGSHTLTVRAYDGHAQSTLSEPVEVTVDNTGGTQYRAAFATSAISEQVVYDPAAPQPFPVDVTATNLSGSTWAGMEVAYRWVLRGQVQDGPAVPLGADVPPGGTRTVRVDVLPPSLPEGTARDRYTLRLDLRDGAGTWFADRGNAPHETSVTVSKALELGAGLERFYHYEGEDLGAGLQHIVNVASGNSILRWTPAEAPGRGLATVVDLTYNSLEGATGSPLGTGFSLSISSLTRFGTPLDVHPTYVDLTDGDGTLHRFTSADGVVWTAPAGVHIHLRRDGAGWAATRPDGVTFRFDTDGNPTSVEDRNGNRITFELEAAPDGGKRVAAVIDAGGRSFELAYDEAGLLRRLTDHDGSALDFEYGATGNLLRIVQRGGTTADGSYLADRTFTFVWAAGADGRMRVQSVRDPRGNDTEFTYLANGKLGSRTNRADEVTSFEYDTVTRVTTVREPLDRVSRYAYDPDGKVTRITNPLQQNIDVEWTAARHVEKVTQPGGAFTEYAYDANGYVTDVWDELRNRTSLEYEHPQPYLSQLVRKTDPKGTATPAPGDYEWLFAYDPRGNVIAVTDPLGFVSRSTYNADGTLATSTDANDHVTTYVAYDANGLLTELRDAKGEVTRFGYDADGLLRWVQDPLHASYSGGDAYTYRTSFYYDSFGRLGRQSSPKSSVHAPRELIWSDVEYDGNDNVVAQVAPYYGWDATRSGAVSRATYDAMDRVVLETGPDTTVDPLGERTQYVYDEAGRLLKSIGPKGVLTPAIPDDHATILTYDALDRVVRETEYDVALDGTVRSTLNTHYCYDLAGDLRRVTAPRAELASVDCAAAAPPFTSRLDYDAAHQLVRQTDPLGNEQTAVYDASGDVVESTDESRARTTYEFDERGQLVESREPFEDGRVLTTRHEYDPVGNLKRTISPRAWDASPDKATFTDFVMSYRYDELDRLVREDLPTGAGTAPAFVHYVYDAGGNLAWKSLPVAVSAAGDVGEGSKSTLTYWDTGWIRTSKHPATARVHFDYTALGQQSFRAPENAAGDVDPERTMLWTYYADGLTKEQKDLGGQVASYRYDASGNVLETAEASGLTSAGQPPLTVSAAYDGLDRTTEVRLRRAGDPKSVVTSYAYDLHANVVEQVSNREEGEGGAVLRPGRRETFTYDGRDLPSVQVDYGLDAGTADDVRVTNLYWPTGNDRQRTIERGGPSGWAVDQTMDWAHYANGLLKTQTTKNASGSIVESHLLSYMTLGGVYQNGHKTRDVFMLKGPDSAAPCYASTCTATYEYDADERLVRSEDGHGGVTTMVLDPAGNVTSESVTSGGTTTTTTNTYVAQQLRTSTKGSEVRRYFYTGEGNLSCVTDGTGTEPDCLIPSGADPPASVVEAYAYDYRNRMASFRRFAADVQTDGSAYVYDPLDRVVEQVETHADELEPRKTTLAYVGDSDVVSGESIASGTGPATQKSYNYDSFGERIGLTHTAPGQPTERFSYGHDTHGSVSLLVKQGAGAQASYGYKPYGDADSALTKGDASTKNPLNAYRYSDKRLDSGSGTIDMGARRFSPDTGRFLQIDQYTDALEDLDLSTDPLTANRYALAGGNPISFIEVDGHGLNPIKALKDTFDSAQCWIANKCKGRLAHTVRNETVKVVKRIAGKAEYAPYLGIAISLGKAANAANRGDYFAAFRHLLDAAGGKYIKGAKKAASALHAASGGRSTVVKVGGRAPINSKYAGQTLHPPGKVGKKYPEGVKFGPKGFPDFAPYAKATVRSPKLTGRHAVDARIANRAAGLKKTPKGMTWHHHQDGKTMQLVPRDLHKAVRHTGGAAKIRAKRRK